MPTIDPRHCAVTVAFVGLRGTKHAPAAAAAKFSQSKLAWAEACGGGRSVQGVRG